ncbi:hypothetical protein, partial [Klebsiella pneumoniae]|uniref:hypothetical protein n=1 Tax=Klebsiella pneumoniae TaxID=573 RepID=UPI00200D8E06
NKCFKVLQMVGSHHEYIIVVDICSPSITLSIWKSVSLQELILAHALLSRRMTQFLHYNKRTFFCL